MTFIILAVALSIFGLVSLLGGVAALSNISTASSFFCTIGGRVLVLSMAMVLTRQATKSLEANNCSLNSATSDLVPRLNGPTLIMEGKREIVPN